MSTEKADKATITLTGKIIKVNINVKKDVSLADAKGIYSTFKPKFSEEILGYYDIEVMLVHDDYAAFGYLKAGRPSLKWTNNKQRCIMKKKNKSKFGLIIGIIAFLLVAAVVILLILFREDKKTSLTILEKRWIEDNKNKIIDIGITYDIPMYSLSGEGVVFEFISDLEKNTGLEFNKVPY